MLQEPAPGSADALAREYRESISAADTPSPASAKPVDSPPLETLVKEYTDGVTAAETAQAEQPLPLDLNETRMRLAELGGELSPLVDAYREYRVREEIDLHVQGAREALQLSEEFTSPVVESMLVQALSGIEGAQAAYDNRHEAPAIWDATFSRALERVQESAAPMLAALNENHSRNDILRAKASLQNVNADAAPRAQHDPQAMMDMTDAQFAKLLGRT